MTPLLIRHGHFESRPLPTRRNCLLRAQLSHVLRERLRLHLRTVLHTAFEGGVREGARPEGAGADCRDRSGVWDADRDVQLPVSE